MLSLHQTVHHRHSVNWFSALNKNTISNQSFVRILLVDDFAPWRRFVMAKLRENHKLRIVGVVSDGLEAIQKAGELQPDLILLDIGLPKVNGIVAARRIRNVAPNSKILFLSQTLDLNVAQGALCEGGHGFLVKSDAERELFAAVEDVMQGKRFLSRRLASPVLAGDVDSQGASHLDGEAIASPTISLSANRDVGRCHEVHFYSDDSLFLDISTRFLSAALSAGDVAVFIGTATHRMTLLERLHAEGPDTRTAIGQGRYVGLNAAEFISDFMASDMPDTGWFLKVADDLIVAARKGGDGEHSCVAVCSECAHIL
jgi:DNA-binding NarL/FixJ family response regulator